VTFTVAGTGSIQANVWTGSASQQGGPVIVYWHGQGSSPTNEVPVAFDVSTITGLGGTVVGFVASSRTGTPTGATGPSVWYESDVAFADMAVACAIEQRHSDPRHIHAAGWQAGALQAVYMWYARSGYVASVVSYSGGVDTINQVALQTPYAAPTLVAHGAMGSDTLILDFATASAEWESIIATDDGTYVDCNGSGDDLDFFTQLGPDLKPVAWQFLDDHPYGVSPEPYTSLPSDFPAFCALNDAGTPPP
jgi:predicted esterase